ncbi:Uncharacterized protein HSRCO_2620 [Halanaeroarchaeum sp. HSR-CO]|uniref:DUF7503 family protein n=1 Tax=Halanaeroarchaeum sp. HSR-CO TaxID=2866382 RepID=UPI00217E4B2C|nr:hypothetical protein [Halanaeroarchaeum sp. HSR-CO]UWG48880.1 Uncharacterized protein HSRCO_2620 [Halanaeroarchaeum sp. HSR-CO]
MSSSVADSASASTTEFLNEHPRMVGVVFMTLLLLSQAGNAAGAVASGNAGP